MWIVALLFVLLSQTHSSTRTGPYKWADGSLAGYFTVEEVGQFFARLHRKHPNSISEAVEIGKTVQGRPILAYLLTRNKTAVGPQLTESGVDINGGQLVRLLMASVFRGAESDSLMVLLNAVLNIFDLDEGPSKHHRDHGLLDRARLWVVPIVNVDAYVANTAGAPEHFGLRGKNLAPGTCPKNASATGVDLTRNFPYGWQASGAPAAPEAQAERQGCADHFAGPKPLSEPEALALQRLVDEREGGSLHGALLLRSSTDRHARIYKPLAALDGPHSVSAADSSTFDELLFNMNRRHYYSTGTQAAVAAALGVGGGDGRSGAVGGDPADWLYTRYHTKALTLMSETTGLGFWPNASASVHTAERHWDAVSAFFRVLLVQLYRRPDYSSQRLALTASAGYWSEAFLGINLCMAVCMTWVLLRSCCCTEKLNLAPPPSSSAAARFGHEVVSRLRRKLSRKKKRARAHKP